MAGGIEVPVHPRPETVIAMCRAISVDDEKGLQLAGHDPKHYAWLLEPARQAMPAEVQYDWFDKLDYEEREKVLGEIQRRHINKAVREQRRIG